MASSDNVVRAGLTSKPIDVDEVLTVVDATPSAPATIEPVAGGGGLARYPSPAEEFELIRCQPLPGHTVEVEGRSTLLVGLCVCGTGRLAAGERGEVLELRSGTAFAARPGAGSLRVEGEGLCLYAAATATLPRR
jgi:mannose-6-phosphate isomerase